MTTLDTFIDMIRGTRRRGVRLFNLVLLIVLGFILPQNVNGQITVINSTNTDGNGATVSLGKPTSTAANDVMIAHISVRGGTGATITPPAGWTLIRRENSGTTLASATYWRVATSASAATYNWTVTSDRFSASLTTFRGVNTSNPINVHNGQANASSTTITAPGVTTTVNDAMLFGMFSTARSDDVNVNTGTPGLNVTANTLANSGGGPNGNGIGAGHRIFATAGATGTRTATTGNANVNIGILIALAPTPPPATQLVFTSSTADLASNTTRELTVEVRDDSNNLVSGDNDRTVTFAKTAGDGTVTNLGTAQTVNGVATRTVTGENVGSITIGATATGLTSGSTSFTIVPGAPNKLEFGVQPTQTQSGSSISPAVTVRILDINDNLVTSATNGVSLALTTPNGANLSGGGSTNAENGVATFSNLSVDLVGSYTLTATATGLSSDVSNSFDITPGDATQLEFGVQPTETQSGIAMDPAVTVRILDANENLVDDATDGITLTLTTPNGANLSGGGSTNAMNGVATFSNLSVDLVGNYTLTATATGLSSDVSNSFDITPGAATQLAFSQQPTTSFVGETISPAVTVRIEDSAGNLTNSTAEVTLAIQTNNGGGTLTGGDATAAVNGVATFSGLSIDAVGTGYTLRATSSGLDFADSNTFNIEAATFYSFDGGGNWDVAGSWSQQEFSEGSRSAAFRAPTFDSDVVIIGDSDTITLNLAVTNNASVSVNNTGILTTGTNVLSGSGNFTLASGGTLQIGSAAGITSDGSGGNIQMSGTLTFHAEANYVYNGSAAQVTGTGLPNLLSGNLTINNTANVSASESLKITGTLFLTDGTFIIGSGLTLIANTKDYTGGGDIDFRQNIGSGAGYRMISSPIAASTFGNFLSGIRTDGYTGSDNPSNQPTVLWYDETFEGTDNQRWRAPSNSTDTVVNGRGYFVYVFETEGATLSVNGQENIATSGSDFTWSVTYTPDGDDGWNLLGNPFGSAIPIGELSRTNINETIYVWDEGTSQFLADNGTTGDLTDQKIAPFQGFWVKANDSSPSLSFSLNDKDTGGSFVGKQKLESAREEVPVISLVANHSEHLKSANYFMFSESGNLKLNSLDGYRLLPPQGVDSYVEFYSRKEKDNRLAINNLPRRFGRPLEIPLEINAFRNGNALTEDIIIEVNELKNIPEGWSIELINEKTGERFPIHTASPGYPTTPGDSAENKSADKGKIIVTMDHLAGQDVELTNSSGKVVTNRKNAHVSMILRIDPGFDADGLSREFYLHQNYPNPFNPTTTFDFDLALPSDVRLEIYDIIGRRVAVLVNESLQAGSHRVVWNASNLSSGMYIARLITHDGAFTRKLTLIK